MLKSKTKIYPAQSLDVIDKFVEIVQITLEQLDMTTSSKKIDNTLFEVLGKGKPGTLLKKNVVSIFFEANEIYVKFKPQMHDPEKFWQKFDKNINLMDVSPRNLKKDTRAFSSNFKNIIDQNIQTKSNNRAQREQKENFVKENIAKKEKISKFTPSDALKEIIKEIETLNEKEKTDIIELFPSLTFEDQKKLVTRIKAVESDLNKIPHLKFEERAEIRKNVLNLSTEKRREKILEIIEKRKKIL